MHLIRSLQCIQIIVLYRKRVDNISRSDFTVECYGHRVDPDTGELIDTVTATMDVGSITYTPKQQEAYRKYREREKERVQRQEELKYRRNNKPKFCFVSAEEQINAIHPATMARLVYLATFLNYDGILKANLQRKMRRVDLESILQLKKSETYNFWNEVNGEYMYEDENGWLHMCSDFSCRGKLPYGGRYQQIFVSSVQELYRKTRPQQHRYLGYVFQMLPYINIEYNILCTNPTEENLDLISHITLDDFCSAIGYSKNQRARLMRVYASITFSVDRKQEQFCAFVTPGADLGRTKIFVNPHILYHGKQDVQTQILGKLCDFST